MNDPQMVERLKFLINEERAFTQACDELATYLNNNPGDHSADLYFQGVLAKSMLDEDSSKYTELARQAEGYTELMEGDLLRDEMLQFIRNRRLTEAKSLVELVRPTHQDDTNRNAVFLMALGRLAFEERNYQEALEYHLYAEDVNWQTLANKGEFIETQWRLNNAFHGFRAAVAARDESAASRFFLQFVRTEPTASGRIKYAETIRSLGRPALMAELWLRRIVFR